MKRAARTLAATLTRLDPAHEQDYKAGLSRWNRKMDQLSSWARKELADIPETDRVLVTGHAAMNHFCREFGFRSISIQGISREDEGNSSQLASTLKKLRSAGVKALFPEYSSNPKSLTEIAKSLNIPVARPINTDGLAPEGHTFESMFRQNTGIIKEALSPSPRP
jgi:ABC-type Zn uptake system ZnuABC Zn-binding protein ZnuA